MAGGAPAPCGRHLNPIQDQNNTKKLFYTHSLNPPHSLNILIHQSNPLNPPQPTHRLTHPHLSNPICPLCKTLPHTTEHLFNSTIIYLKQLTGPLDVSREGGASASQIERTPGRATLTYWLAGPLHSYTQEGWVDNNNNMIINIYSTKRIQSARGWCATVRIVSIYPASTEVRPPSFLGKPAVRPRSNT